MEVGKSLMSIPSFDIPDYTALFSEEKSMISKLKKTFLMIAGKAVQTFGMELEKQQQLIMNIADILIQIYVAESTLLKTEKLVHRTDEANCEGQIAIAKLNLYNAVETTIQKGKESIISFTSGDEQRMLLMGLRRFTKYSNMPNIIALRNTIAHKISQENKYCF